MTSPARSLARQFRARTGIALLAAAAAATLVAGAPAAQAEPALPPELEAVRTALDKYRDPVAAVRDGYFSTLGCVAYEEGGMGVHFLNTALMAPVPDPMKPQILVYEPDGDGKLQLVAAEWLIPLATGVSERPELLGQPFEGPMEGHEPLMPKELHHYDLHVWLFKENPDGVFHHTNPNVSCDNGSPYAMMEEPPATVEAK